MQPNIYKGHNRAFYLNLTTNTHTMGIFWDLMQQDELEKQEGKATLLEERVGKLEKDLTATRALLRKTLVALETHLTQDIDGDGKMGE